VVSGGILASMSNRPDRIQSGGEIRSLEPVCVGDDVREAHKRTRDPPWSVEPARQYSYEDVTRRRVRGGLNRDRVE